MKKSSILALAICASGTLAFADTDYTQWQNPWFKAIGDSVTSTSLNPTGGAWGDFPDGATIDTTNNALNFDLDSGDAVTFTPVAPGDTNTTTKITVRAKFNPALESELKSKSDMGDALFGFAVVDGDPKTYRAWLGGDSWETLEALGTPGDGAITLVCTINNWDGAKTIKFAIGSAKTDELTLTSTKASAGQVAGFSLEGSGTLSEANSDVQYAVAAIGDKRYPTLNDAATDASASAGETTIDVLRDTNEGVQIGSDVTIKGNGHATGDIEPVQPGGTIKVEVVADEIGGGVSGEYTLKVKTSDASKVAIKLPNDNKEVASQELVGEVLKITTRTKDTILESAVTQAGAKLQTKAELRTFLDTYAAGAYKAADANVNGIATALSAGGENTLPLWQDYALGIAPDTSLVAEATPGSDGGPANLTIKIPNLVGAVSSGDYDISYVVGGTKTSEAADTKTGVIEVPMATDKYDIKIKFTEKQ